MRARDEELKELIAKGGVQFVPPLRLEFETDGGKSRVLKSAGN